MREQNTNGLLVNFSSAHRYFRPGASEEENRRLYGEHYSIDGQGHNFDLEVMHRGRLSSTDLLPLLERLDHSYLNDSLALLMNTPLTTESLAQVIATEVESLVPAGTKVDSITLREGRDLWSRASTSGGVAIYQRAKINCVHRHHNPNLSEEENASLFGKCSGLHGHEYRVELGVFGDVDLYSGLIVPRPLFRDWLQEHIVTPFDKTYLNEKMGNSSGEIIVSHFYGLLREIIPSEYKISVSVHETRKNSFLLEDEVFSQHFAAI